MKPRAESRANEILDVVVDLLESEGYEAVQVRTVAKRARISLTTMYKLFGPRDQLIVTAIDRWMEATFYATMTMPEPGESPYETLVGVLRMVFEPWEQHPRMLEAYHRARSRPGGDRLVLTGLAIVRPIAEAALAETDPQYLVDMQLIFSHVVRAAIARFADGEIEITEILPILERTLFRLMTDNYLETGRSRPRAVGAAKRSTPRKPQPKSSGRGTSA